MTLDKENLQAIINGWNANTIEGRNNLTEFIFPFVKRLAHLEFAGDEAVATPIQLFCPDEICQTVCAQLLQKHEYYRFTDPGQFLGFIRKMVHTTVVNHTRKLSSKRLREPGDDVRQGDVNDATQVIEEDNQFIQLSECIDQLEKENKEYSQIFSFKYILGLSDESICELLDISESTMYRRLRLAKAYVIQKFKA